MKDTYKTLARESPESIYKEKGSKFIAQAFHINSEAQAQEHLDMLWQKHAKASHICYAWQLGKNYDSYRANDDGEPTYSAGMPIYNQIQAFELTEVLVTVIRYYGGTNLGVGGLVQAYKTSAHACLERGHIITRNIKYIMRLQFDYAKLHMVMRLIKEKNLTLIAQEMHLDCRIDIEVRKRDAQRIKKNIEAIAGITLELIKN